MFFSALLVSYQTGYWLKFASIGALFSNSPLNMISGVAVITALSWTSILTVVWGRVYLRDLSAKDLQVRVGSRAEVYGNTTFFFVMPSRALSWCPPRALVPAHPDLSLVTNDT